MRTLKTFLIFTIIGITSTFAQGQTYGLKDVYPDFKFGNVLNSSTVTQQKMKDLVLREFNSITPENELKPNATMTQTGSTDTDIKVNLSSASAILKFCQDNNIPVRGHTLVWHSQTPPWFFRANMQSKPHTWDDKLTASDVLADAETMNKRMESYIKNIFALIKKNYPNLNLYAYDVVNEAFENWGGNLRPGGIDQAAGQSPWMKIYGSNQYIINAFAYARQYAPENCKLFYNDYNEYGSDKCNSIVSLANKLKGLGTIDGIGMQSHLDLPETTHTVSAFGAALKKFAATGLEVQVTEIDVTIPNIASGQVPTVSEYEAQGRKYRDIMKEVLKYKDSVTAFVVWGIQDNQSWRSNRFPVLFDKNGNKKPAYDELFALGTLPSSNPELQFDNSLKAWANGNQLQVTGVDVGKMWRVYTTTGVLVHQGISLGRDVVHNVSTIQSGAYIVWTENGTTKVIF
ncbi:MAG: endo-1,4-beta-xylanase [Dysgonamonadaceae bacterium]|jgi:GH35 family endo-1,4-beta-xylanase|nr:endo-1,4-beta-xylanase [Dysgonamonadaceae bacterium]